MMLESDVREGSDPLHQQLGVGLACSGKLWVLGLGFRV